MSDYNGGSPTGKDLKKFMKKASKSKALHKAKGVKHSYSEAKERHNDNYGDTMLAK